MNQALEQARQNIRRNYLTEESVIINGLVAHTQIQNADRLAISRKAADLVEKVRQDSTPSMMEKFLAEYGLSTKEGVALMCLAEALLRVPDSMTIDALIEDKVTSGNWQEHLGRSDFALVNSSTWALLLTGKLLERPDDTSTLKGMIKRLGEPVVRSIVAQAMKELGRQFVLGRTIAEATQRGSKMEKRGYTYSYDMLGEAARTDKDALRYHQAYAKAIAALAENCKSDDIRKNPGISVKLSALHARYELAQKYRVMTELVERTVSLAVQAKEANMGFNIDAEEADRLDLSLDVIEAVLSDARLAGWDGFGIVVQAYGRRASFVLDWLYALAQKLDRRIMVRLVKGAYWDTEVKRAQVLGLADYPVFTRKVNTDLSYMCCADKLLHMTDRIYPQFATHNAHSVSAIQHLAELRGISHYEFQRLHGMGEALHDAVLQQHKTRCRIYAPVGAHQDLLAYLVRRLLENGANSSFVNQIVDHSIPPALIAGDPFKAVEALGDQVANPQIPTPKNLFGPNRVNAKGWDITDVVTLDALIAKRDRFGAQQWQASPLIAQTLDQDVPVGAPVLNPANPNDKVGTVRDALPEEIEAAVVAAQDGFAAWSQTPVAERAACLRRVADLYESHAEELFAIASREAGKTLLDAVAEIREAVDFARYYANEAERLGAREARGVVTCISPWNFPLAIFSGQILAALAAGNAVLAKPADQTPLMAYRAVQLMHEAGIPKDVVQLLPGSGVAVGAPLTADARIAAVCFTGSTLTAQRINKNMADHMAPSAPLVAETGGMNAMIVDSTALPEQVVRDVLMSAFQSAGQRCSALRVLYVQEDIAASLLEMLYGAMDELHLGNPWLLNTDVGPVIDLAAKQKIDAHIARFKAHGKLLKQLGTPNQGSFVAPTVLKVQGIEELSEEIFGPVLHVATFKAKDLDKVVDAINAKGYGLTFGIHSRVDHRVDRIVNRIAVGNIYVNRNQIGAIVGSQPFGGEGLSGTGPKAGGPHYVQRFTQSKAPLVALTDSVEEVSIAAAQALLDKADSSTWKADPEAKRRLEAVFDRALNSALSGEAQATEMPGPTGELNLLSQMGRGTVLCLGPDMESLEHQVMTALAQGNVVVAIAPNLDDLLVRAAKAGLPLTGLSGQLPAAALKDLQGFAAVCANGPLEALKAYRQALAEREGALLPLITEWDQPARFVMERHLCVDTTAAGGNVGLIAASS